MWLIISDEEKTLDLYKINRHLSQSVAKKVVLKLEVCSQPTNPSRRVGSVFRGWWVGLGYEFFFNSRSSWVQVITITTGLTRTDLPIYLKFKLYIFNIILQIYFIINNFFKTFFYPIRLFLYKTQLLYKS